MGQFLYFYDKMICDSLMFPYRATFKNVYFFSKCNWQNGVKQVPTAQKMDPFHFG